tara:strand:+ start:2376 stop:2630 length:255 start_codon:yes stop_codon:yes gene_type:complete
MSNNVIDFTDYQNRTAILELATESENDAESVDHEIATALLTMYDAGLLTITYDEDGELLFQANQDVTEEEWDVARILWLSSLNA